MHSQDIHCFDSYSVTSKWKLLPLDFSANYNALLIAKLCCFQIICIIHKSTHHKRY